jgi:hypothetical protein
LGSGIYIPDPQSAKLQPEKCKSGNMGLQMLGNMVGKSMDARELKFE